MENKNNSETEKLAKTVNGGIKATQHFFLIIALVILVTTMFAVTGKVGGFITLGIVVLIVWAIKTGKMKLH
jgi:hypothetical protein